MHHMYIIKQLDIQFSLKGAKMTEQEQLQTLKSNLSHIKTMAGDNAEEQFFNLMEKCKKAFGEDHLYMAEFYFEYAKFIIDKLQKNVDIFNTQKLPEAELPDVQEQGGEDDDDSSVVDQKPENTANVNQQQADNDMPAITQEKQQKAQKQQKAEQENEEQNSQQNYVVSEQKQEEPGKEQKKQEQEDDDDFQVCAANLAYAIKIFEAEKERLLDEGEPKIYSLEETKKFISRCRSRLGDLYHLNENYMAAVQIYKKVVEDEQQNIDSQSNRGLAQIHYMIANSYLYQNKKDCEMIAIQQFIIAVQILLNHMHKLNPTDQTVYQVPSIQQTKVDRFSYLPRATDSQQAKQIKQVISCLLDKIEDSYQQIGIRQQYQQQKTKNKQEQPNKFNEIKNNTPTVNLGTFGNRKRKTEKVTEE